MNLRPHALLVGTLLFGCSSSKTPDTSSTPLPCEVDAVFAAHCRECHAAVPQYGAPMPLMTWEDLHAPAKSDPSKLVYQLVETRIHDDQAPMPQPPNPRLDDATSAVLDTWIAAGAPAKTGTDACSDAGQGGAGGASGAGGAGGSTAVTDSLQCTPDVSVRATTPWAMPQNETDIYVCYGMDVPVTGQRQAIGFQPHVDNTKIVHHMLLYQSETSVSSTPAACSGTAIDKNKLVYGWAPGGLPFELPDAAGYPMSTSDAGDTAHYVVQVHYNNIQGLSGETDLSGFDLCSTDQIRPNTADVIAFGSMDFTIEPHAALDITCDYTIPTASQTLHVMSAFPHMHQLGTTIATTSTPIAGGDDISLGAVPNWSFNNQIWYPMETQVSPGDIVHTRCAWQNTTDKPVSFGEYTEDEMCYSFTMYYPSDPTYKAWLSPALGSQCHPTAQ
jgi:hypothetical protein